MIFYTNKRVVPLSAGGIKKGSVTSGEVLSLGYRNCEMRAQCTVT